jgi:hypothetical protein
MSPRTRFLVKLLVSLGLLWLVAHEADLAGLQSRLGRLAPGLAALALAVLLFQLCVAALRWHLIAGVVGVALPLRLLWRHLLVAQCFSQALPSSVGGDVIRIWLVQRSGVALRPAFVSVVLDRLLGLLSLVLVVVVALLLPSAVVFEETARIAVWTIAACAVAGLAAVLIAARLPATWFAAPRVLRVAHETARGMDAVCTRPWTCLGVTLSSVLVHLLSIAGIWLLARGLGIDVGAPTLAATVPLALLAASVPVSIGGWGVREGVLVHLLATQGVAADAALALSLSFGMALALASLPGGLLWLMTRSRLANAAEAVQSDYQAL